MTVDELRDLLVLIINRSGVPIQAHRIVEDPDGIFVQSATGDAFFVAIAATGD